MSERGNGCKNENKSSRPLEKVCTTCNMSQVGERQLLLSSLLYIKNKKKICKMFVTYNLISNKDTTQKNIFQLQFKVCNLFLSYFRPN